MHGCQFKYWSLSNLVVSTTLKKMVPTSPRNLQLSLSPQGWVSGTSWTLLPSLDHFLRWNDLIHFPPLFPFIPCTLTKHFSQTIQIIEVKTNMSFPYQPLLIQSGNESLSELRQLFFDFILGPRAVQPLGPAPPGPRDVLPLKLVQSLATSIISVAPLFRISSRQSKLYVKGCVTRLGIPISSLDIVPGHRRWLVKALYLPLLRVLGRVTLRDAWEFPFALGF